MPSTGIKKTTEKQKVVLRTSSHLAVKQPVAIWRLALALFLISINALAYEVLLTRLFSLAFQYHYAFLAVSLAILGLGLGALIAWAYRSSLSGPKLQSRFGWLLLGLGLSLPVTAFLFSQLSSAVSVIAHVLIGLLPFLLAGIVSATIYGENSRQGAILYAADLFGSALGLLVITLVLNYMGAFQSTFLLGLFSIAAALLLGITPSFRTSASAGAVILFMGLITSGKANLDLPLNLKNASPDKVMYHILADSTQEASLIDSAWSPFARVDLVKTRDPEQMYVFTDAGAGSFMIHFDGNLHNVAWLKEQPGYLPFAVGPVGRTLILGSGAGKDILQARLAGSQEITAVEINPAIIALTSRHAGYNGGVLDLAGVRNVVTDGRNFVERDSSQYDLIYLNLVYSQASEPGSGALTESYIFTQEAFRLYWNHLTPNGRLAIISHQALEGSRGLMTAIGSLQAEGLKSSDVLSRSVLVMLPDNDPNQRLTVFMLKKSPWTAVELQQFRKEYESQGVQALYVPGVFEVTLHGLTADEITLDRFLSEDPTYNLAPTSDDRPFFFNLYPGLPVPLNSLLRAVGIVTIGYLGMAIALRKPTLSKRANRSTTPLQNAWQRFGISAWKLGYFGLLGLGFMLIEVPLIQRAILLLGNPTLALVVVIGGLLLSAGIGSLLSSHISEDKLLKWVTVAGVIIATLAIVAAYSQPLLADWLLSASLTARAVAVGLLLLPIGIPMGLPFSSGLRLAGRDEAGFVPVLWGWNAVTSVLGSVLATAIAMKAGFHWALLAGGAAYLALSFLTAGFVVISRQER